MISGAVLMAAGVLMTWRPEWFDLINWKMRWMVPDDFERAFVTRLIGVLLSFVGLVATVLGLAANL